MINLKAFFSSLAIFLFLSSDSNSREVNQDTEDNSNLHFGKIYTQDKKVESSTILSEQYPNNHRILEERADASSVNSIDPATLGPQTIRFSSPFLEKYAKGCALFCTTSDAILDDLEDFTHAAAACLIVLINSNSSISDNIVPLAIQIGLVAHAFSKFNNYVSQAVQARSKLAQESTKINVLQKIAIEKEKKNPTILRDITADEEAFLQSNYSTPFLQDFFKRLTIARIIMWDIFGVSSIIFRSAAYSLANWSIHTQENKSLFLTGSAICGVLGSFCELYVKKIKKNTETSEGKVIISEQYNGIMKRTQNIYASNITEEEKSDEENQAA